MYIHIPKTSGTNLRQVFLNSSNDIINYDETGRIKNLSISAKNIFWGEKNISDILEHPFLYLSEVDYSFTKHSPLWVWQKSGDWNNHKIITIVRNPYTRAVSLYKQILRMFGETVNQNMNFSDFLFNSTIQSVVDRFPHSYKTQQIDYLKDINGSIKIDRFYKMEMELDQLSMDYNLTDIHTTKYNSGNYSKNYLKIYDDYLIDWVRKNYADDFEYFGYSINPFWM
jgi:hypothetical protein